MVRQPTYALGRLSVQVSRYHTVRHTQTPGSTPLNKWSARRRGLYIHNKQQAEGANIRAFTVIRTRDPGT
jgi:hypothetical protein